MAKLILSLDDVVLEEISLSKERTTIGRKPQNDIQIDNLAVSGEHAVIVTILNDCFLEDLGSTNGTLVNGVLAKKHLLQNNDVIELGKYKLKFEGMASSPAPTPADYEKTMIWRPGGVKPPAAPGGAPAAPAAPPVAKPATPPAPKPAAPPQPPPAAARPAPPPPPAAAPATKAPAPKTRLAPDTPPPAPRAAAPAAAPPAPQAGPRQHGVVRILSGERAGRDVKLEKPLTTLGKPGTQVAVVTRRHEGFFIAHVEGATPTHVNGRPIGATPHALKDRDTFEIADVRMEFLLQDAPAEESPSRFWKIGLVVLGLVIVAIIYYRMRG